MIPNASSRNQRPSIVEVTMSQVQPEEVRWLWPNWIACGHLHVIAGDPDVGKSFFTCDLAATVSTGRDWPDGSPNQSAGDVFMLVGEDDLGTTVRPRLDAHQANVERVHAFESREILKGRFPDLVEAIKRHPELKLIIVDTMNDFVEMGDGNNGQECRDGLTTLFELAKQHNIAVVMITHTPKRDGKLSRRAIDSVIGSRALSAMPRFVYAMAKSQDNPSLRIIAPIKANLVEKKVARSFEITDKRVKWHPDAVSMTADDLLSSKTGPASDRVGECVEWIQATLGCVDSIPSNELNAKAKEAGFSVSTFNRARKPAKVQSFRVGETWHCRLFPESSNNPESNVCHPSGPLPEDSHLMGP